MEKTFKIPLGEIRIVRLLCGRKDCGGVAEMPSQRLVATTGSITCPSCGHELTAARVGGVDGFKALGMVLESLTGEKSFSIEFVLPCPTSLTDGAIPRRQEGSQG